MGGSTADAFDSANKYSSAKLGKLQEHTERQTNELAKTAEKNLEGSVDNTLGAFGRGTTKGLQAMGLMAGGNDSGGGSDGSASANYSNKSTASSKGSGKKADLSKDKSKKLAVKRPYMLKRSRGNYERIH